MTFRVGNLVKETTTTTGVGDLTLLGAWTGSRPFSAICSDGDTFPYAIGDPGDAEREVGIGTWHTGNTMSRTTILESTNSNAAVSLSTGTKKVYLAFPVELLGFVPFGSTLPTSPQVGSQFLHTPTGRSVLLTYVGGTWHPSVSYGSMTLYVDGASGTDSINKGFGTGADAYATIQYAIDAIPGSVGGNVGIQIAAGTYAENVVVLGKNFTGDYSITFTGARTTLDSLTASGGAQGANATQGDVVSPGAWTTNQRENKLVRVTSGSNSGVTRLIDSNTTTTALIVEVWPNGSVAGGSTFVVEDWASLVAPASGIAFSVGANQANIKLVDMALVGAAGFAGLTTSVGSSVTITCTSTSVAASATTYGVVTVSGKLTIDTCFLTNASNGDRILGGDSGGIITMDRSKVLAAGASTSYAVILQVGASMRLQSGNVIEVNGGGYGIEIEASVLVAYTANSHNKIRNGTVGINAAFGGTAFYSASGTYIDFSGNGTNTVADAATYSSIS